jgi:tetratricopeptide (TPR) repeat protein
LLLPLVYPRGDGAGPTFWQLLKLNLGSQKSILVQLSNYFRHSEPWKFIALLITSLVPLILVGIRWPSYFGDISKLGQGLATLTFHIVHALLLVVCVWLAFDPPFSARQMQFGNEFLLLNYLACLNVGYFSGYFLLVFAPKLRPVRTRHREQLVPMLNRLSKAALGILLIAVPLVLLYKNLPQIRITNGPLMRQFSASLAGKLPADGAYVLSDDPRLLFLLQDELARRKQPEQRYVLLDSGIHGEGFQALNLPQYHRFLHKKYGEQWPEPPPLKQREVIAPYSLLETLMQVAGKKPLYYLHPSFGYYFEVFYPVPHGLVYELKTFGTNSVVPPPVSNELIAENEKFWKENETGLLRDVIAAHRLNTAAASKFRADFHAALQMPTSRNATAKVLAGYCSRGLNFWSVELQKANQTDQAGPGFNRALEVNPENVTAQINADFNQSLQAAPAKRPKVKELVDDPRFRNLDQIVNEHGPFDEPTFCFERAREFSRSVLYRQAAQQLTRVVTWEPANLEGQLWLARIYTVLSMPAKAVAIVNDIHARANEFNLGGTNQIELLLVESAAHFANRDNAAGEAVLRTALEKNPNDESVIATAAQVAIAYGRYSNALLAVERQLALKADDLNSLVNKGFLLMQLGQLEQALPSLNRAVEISPTNHPALLNRAITYLRAGKLDQSEQDYLALQKAFPNAFQIYYGLAEIAWQRKDTNAAIGYYDAYLTNKPPASTEAESVAERLKQLKGGSP